MSESILPDHFPEILSGAHEFALFCGCGAQFRHPDKKTIQGLWATHVGGETLKKLLQKPT
jgi:hypothetical protein